MSDWCVRTSFSLFPFPFIFFLFPLCCDHSLFLLPLLSLSPCLFALHQAVRFLFSFFTSHFIGPSQQTHIPQNQSKKVFLSVGVTLTRVFTLLMDSVLAKGPEPSNQALSSTRRTSPQSHSFFRGNGLKKTIAKNWSSGWIEYALGSDWNEYGLFALYYITMNQFESYNF